MKTNKSHLAYRGLALAFFVAGLGVAMAQTSPAPAPANDNPPAQESPPPAAPIPLPAEPSTQPAPPLDPPVQPQPAGDGLIHLNFRGVPLDMVLDHLSEAAGFIIVKDAEVQGTVDVWSNQPLTKDEAVDLLNTILKQNDYAAVRNNRTLTIVKLDEAKRRDVPVKKGGSSQEIPRNDEVVTQIIPVRYANALMLTQNLQPLLPEHASLSANESGNALVLTDTQASIRRMVEIVEALDTSISSIATIRVFPLRYADAKELAQVVTQLFEPPQQNRNDRRAQFFSQFGGRGGRGGDDGGNGPSLPLMTGDNRARDIASRVISLADERMNALIVAAPDEFIPDIEQLVKQVDVPISDITELRVFRLQNSDPVEMAALFKELFPDENASAQNQRGGPQGFPGFRFGRDDDNRRRNNNNVNTEDSERKKAASQVMAVADPRTSSLIVSAASELMPQIEAMIKQLDSSPAKKQKVFVYDLENADPTQVEQILRDMFERNTSQTSRSRNNTANQTSTLDNRRQNQNNANNGGGFGNSGGFGGGNAFGGRGGNQAFP